jgi:hypothetical protein
MSWRVEYLPEDLKPVTNNTISLTLKLIKPETYSHQTNRIVSND